jgi:lysozyme family protein
LVNITALIASENTRWRAMVVQPQHAPEFGTVAARLVRAEAKAIYQEIEAATGVPWFVTAVIHEREASQSWARSIAQGDRWDGVSTHVPIGRGPFKSFKAAAVDALVNCAPKAARWTDWSIGGLLTLLEEYNGLGYAGRGVPSPYIWAGTDQYVSGKYVRDGVYDPHTVDPQFGCAGLLMAMQRLDPSIHFGVSLMPAAGPTARVSPSRPAVPVVPTVHDAPPLAPSITHPASGSLGDAIVKLFEALFGHLHH